MSRFVLTFCKQGVFVSSVIIADKPLIVGRANECDVRLLDNMISRKHARLWIENGQLFIEDLGSRNGTYLNQERITKSQLHPGSEVTLGTHTLSVESDEEQKTLVDTSSLIPFDKANDIYVKATQEEGKGYLPILYRAAQLMGTVSELDTLLREVLKLVLDSMHVRRGFILTLAPGNREPKIRAALPEGEVSACPPLSRTLLHSVFEEKSAILTVNALEDKRFDSSESVIAHNIHSAMCVPLCGRNDLLGALYVDSGKDTIVFTNDDLELLTALGRVIGMAIENSQLQEEKLRNERLAAIGQATAGIGHCVKGLLAGLKGGAEFVERGVKDSDWDWVKKGCDLVNRVSDRIEELVMNLMTFSRDPKPLLGPVNLPALVEEVFSAIRPRAQKRNVSLELQINGELPEVYADNRDIFRVLMNLVNNGVDACEEKGGKVSVSLRKDEDGFYIEVSDTGCGIPPEVADRLFQAFVSTKGSRGTGLGLACCDRLVRAHHGEIWVESSPGKGTTFTVFLPHKPSQAEQNHPHRPTLLMR